MLPTSPREADRSICNSCTTPAVSTATRVSCGVMFMSTSSMERAYRVIPSLRGEAGGGSDLQDRHSRLPQQLRGLEQRQPHHAGIAAFEPLHEHGGKALDGVSARLV